ncbi:MAG: indolepyruvate ferredoxin oxidoreductase subunit alpha [Lachnospiraceae bacterium]|nr:indolepyruvate ferredoxin oxidoreductase subunit alpha [Lachnospiraceae bacterium]
MHKEFVMGNEAIALGAIAAGVNLVSGYPGTPSTEVLETVSKRRTQATYVEWSVNEKAGLEVAAGAAYTGARTMVTMKQVGLNVASDPLMSLAYIGVKGGMVVLVADDPGPISSQTEQDTRTFAAYSKLPIFDPTGVAEAYEMIQEAFDYSEKYKTPVIFRTTTRISHGYASIDVKDEAEYRTNTVIGFEKKPDWVIFPRLSFRNHTMIEERNVRIGTDFSGYGKNSLLAASGDFVSCRRGIATHGISYQYTMENLDETSHPKLLKVATPFPFPEELALSFLEGLDEVLCVEELDPALERALTYVCGKYHLPVKIFGKLTGNIPAAGENSVESVGAALKSFFGASFREKEIFDISDAPALPVRPPVLCAGCPHRASFYAVKRAAAGRKALFSGDIGCYTLGNAAPLDMTDTCLCMGAGITLAQGIGRMEPDTVCFSFTGDSTFFASGITGIVNAYYNQANMTAVILDNSTTAMTGHQPHPGTGKTMMGEVVSKVSIEKVLRAIGLETVVTVDPLDQELAIRTVKEVMDQPGVKAIIFKSPCIALVKSERTAAVDQEKCIRCKKCIREFGCPGIVIEAGQVKIDTSLCTGCGLCAGVCPKDAIQTEVRKA